MLNQQELLKKRNLIEQLRQSSSLSLKHADQLGQSILSSWQRSKSASIPQDREAAPLSNVKQDRKTVLEKAIELCKNELLDDPSTEDRFWMNRGKNIDSLYETCKSQKIDEI